MQFPHHDNVARPVLDDAKQAQDDHDDVEEVDHDGRPLVAEEVKHLPLQRCDLLGSRNSSDTLMMTYREDYVSVR